VLSTSVFATKEYGDGQSGTAYTPRLLVIVHCSPLLRASAPPRSIPGGEGVPRRLLGELLSHGVIGQPSTAVLRHSPVIT
jgi:hypothetical protein